MRTVKKEIFDEEERNLQEMFRRNVGAIGLEEDSRRRIWEGVEKNMREETNRKGKESVKNRREPSSRRRRWIPAVCCAAGVCLVGVGMGLEKFLGTAWGDPSEGSTESFASGATSETYVVAAEDRFIVEGKIYTEVLPGNADWMGKPFPSVVPEKDLGEPAGTIEGGGELNGKTAYVYAPGESQALLAVERDGEYRLYVFYMFVSYEENGEEDAADYLKVYGVESAQDFVSVELIQYPADGVERSLGVLSERETEEFYDMFSNLKDGSAAYFKALSSYDGETNSVEDTEEESGVSTSSTLGVEIQTQQGAGEEGGTASFSPGSEGSHALDDSVCVRITVPSGLMMEFWYYPRIGFLSRYAATPELQEFLESRCGY